MPRSIGTLPLESIIAAATAGHLSTTYPAAGVQNSEWGSLSPQFEGLTPAEQLHKLYQPGQASVKFRWHRIQAGLKEGNARPYDWSQMFLMPTENAIRLNRGADIDLRDYACLAAYYRTWAFNYGAGAAEPPEMPPPPSAPSSSTTSSRRHYTPSAAPSERDAQLQQLMRPRKTRKQLEVERLREEASAFQNSRTVRSSTIAPSGRRSIMNIRMNYSGT